MSAIHATLAVISLQDAVEVPMLTVICVLSITGTTRTFVIIVTIDAKGA